MKEESTNPYTPWNNDPVGMLIGPFGFLALLFARKKKHTKLDAIIVVLILLALMGFGSIVAMPVQAAGIADAVSMPIAPQSYAMCCLASKKDTSWQYTYGGNDSLLQIDPGTCAANGSTRYTYNTAGYLVKLETHNGTDWQTQSEMKYDGLGNRLEMTIYVDATPSMSHYQLDNGQT